MPAPRSLSRMVLGLPGWWCRMPSTFRPERRTERGKLHPRGEVTGGWDPVFVHGRLIEI